MKLFGQLVRTVVNTAMLPIEIAKDVVTLGGVCTDEPEPYTIQQLKRLKDEASED